MWHLLFAREDEKNWLIYISQMFWLTSWHVSFYVTNKVVAYEKLLVYTTRLRNVAIIVSAYVVPDLPNSHWALCVHISVRISAVQGYYWRTKRKTADKCFCVIYTIK